MEKTDNQRGKNLTGIYVTVGIIILIIGGLLLWGVYDEQSYSNQTSRVDRCQQLVDDSYRKLGTYNSLEHYQAKEDCWDPGGATDRELERQQDY